VSDRMTLLAIGMPGRCWRTSRRERSWHPLTTEEEELLRALVSEWLGRAEEYGGIGA